MVRFVALLVALTVGGVALAQSAPSHPKAKKAVPAAAQAAEDPNDVTAAPRNVEKWIGGAMDDILTGTDKALDDVGGKR